jgi:hypothetical protein
VAHICRVCLTTVFVLAFSWAATAQVAILQIRVIEGEGTVHAPGSRSTRPLTVEVTDETGKPVEGAAVSFHLPDNGPGGVFTNGMRTDVALTDSHGHASVHGLQWNRDSGQFMILIVASKEQARAGMASFQYIAGTGSGAAAATAGRSHGYRKWIVVALLAGGGAAAGILLAERSGSTPAAAATAPAVTLTIGAPVITVGKP